MAVASTGPVALTRLAWVLLADGSAGVTDVLAQIHTTGPAFVRLALSLPGPEIDGGIVLRDGDNPLSAGLLVGQKIYGRAVGQDAVIMVMVGGK